MFRIIFIILGIIFVASAFIYIFLSKDTIPNKKEIIKRNSFNILVKLVFIIVGLIK